MENLINNVILITPYDLLTGYCVIIEDGKIAAIELEDNIDTNSVSEVIDGRGLYLAPGFIDIHNHGNSSYDIMDSTDEALDKIGEFHIKNGVTSYLGTVITSSYENITNAIRNIVEYKNKDYCSQIIGIHLEGPFLSIEKKGAQPAKFIKKPAKDTIKEIVEISKGRLKMVSLAPEVEGALEVISYLKSKDIVVSMAHSSATYMEAEIGVDYGITVATHLYNGMRDFNHREPGVIGLSLLDDRVYCELINDRIHLHDGAIEIALRLKGVDKIILVSDAMRAAGIKGGDYELGGQKVIVKDGVARLESGSLAGSTLNLREAVYNMVYYFNIPINDAIRMASLSPAKAIKIDKYKGSIEIGKDADLLLVDKDINIHAVIIGGNTIVIK